MRYKKDHEVSNKHLITFKLFCHTMKVKVQIILYILYEVAQTSLMSLKVCLMDF